ncbi:GGDEF domain-containing protein [Sporosarcina gallistercoris]|uniref:GGDEF domain-containing protein n=1 Tax=Sporosarcina gallistercoris TaxID=2762245 RepID=A0ABR8PJR9_9BACL|nr:GGDEF domain-containing protein [Sporosarcina gallistercoris]MBD7908399.1 GGDEF domain-containing protein [Sporosarcina gallistercoris]
MLNNPHKQWIALLLWLLVVPTSLYVIYVKFPFKEIDMWFLILNFIMLVVAMSVSFQIFSISISLERWIIFVIFFQYGLFAEMVFMQLALIILQFVRKSSLPAFYRFTTNSLMFAIVSITSAFCFHYAGGSISEMPPWAFLAAAAVYAISYSLINSLILYCIMKIERTSFDDFKQVALWDFAITMVVLPLAVAYSLLTYKLGVFSVMLLGVPFLLILLIIRKYAFSGEFNKKLSSAVDIGHELTESLSTHEVIEVFTKKIRGVVNYDQAYILDIYKETEFHLLACSEAGNFSKEAEFFTFKNEAIPLLSPNKINVYSSHKEIEKLEHLQFSSAVQSVMVAPIIRAGKLEAYLIMTSFRRNFFEEIDKKMVDLLTGYFETSVMKAFHYELTIEKSEKCGLTKLYNFRYLTKKLSEELSRFHEQEISSVSAIILDIDHFKSINDNYGHQSGNDILCSFAQILKKYETDGRTLARYGGEEFVLLLPDFTKKEAVTLAERIRLEVEQHTFMIKPDLTDNIESIGVNLTVSLGVSSIPEDTKSDNSLLRNADRALYIGGKQAGRNRVGVYEGEQPETIEI